MDNRERKFDELLDNALADYTNVEPRAGLEGRILTNLAAVEPEKKGWFRWWPAMALAAAAVVALAIFIAIPRETPNAPQVEVKTPSVVAPVHVPSVAPSEQVQVAEVRHHVLRAHIRESHLPAATPQLAAVKQPVFPAPSPLTDQERLLFTYMRKTNPAEIAANAKPDVIPAMLQNYEQINQVLPGPRNTDTNTNTR